MFVRSSGGGTYVKSRVQPPKHGPLWATIVIAFGLILTAAWIGLLGYGLVKLIELAI